ncbi:MAG: drug/metabolite transporter (DMT)-like permease [Gammaproteobacteria bacterium]|jgi:drug/metabolite transporter (DMT)-like permease
MDIRSKASTGVFFALATAIGLGAITTQAKIIYSDGGNALTVMLARFVISTLVFGAIIFIKRGSFKVERQLISPLILVGVVWSVAMIFYMLSVESISVSLAVLILYAYPMLVLIYAMLRKQLKPSVQLLSIFALAFIGLYLALSSGEIKLSAMGLVFAGLASIGAAMTFIKGATVAPLIKPLLMTFWVSLIGLVIIIPIVYTQFSLPQSDAGLIALSTATLFYMVAILCQFQALARLPATAAAFILNLEPVVSILLAVFILQEYLNNLQWVGIALVISVLLVSIRIKPGQA